MNRLSIKKMTGCSVFGQPVIIYDLRGVEFYCYPNKIDRPFYFNLPVGEYLTPCNIKFCEPIKNGLPKLPKFEKRIKPRKLNVRFGNNPNKASINVFFGNVLVDEKIKEKPIPEIVFILFHEYAHHYYYDEHKCDVFAAREMIKRGFNPSQCNISVIHALSENSQKRKYELVNKINAKNAKHQ